MNSDKFELNKCCFCGEQTPIDFCGKCVTVIKQNHTKITNVINLYLIEEEQKHNEMNKKQAIAQEKVQVINVMTPHYATAEYKREWRAKKKKELGEEEFKKQATAEKRVQRTGTADAKHLLTPEEKLERRQLSDKKYQEKQKAKKEQQ